MARYLVLLKFNSQANADLFLANPYNSAVLGATQATVPSGFVGPSGPSTGIGQPSSSPSSTYTYVDIYVPSISSIPKGYYNPNGPSATQLILDLDTRVPVYISPNIDPNSITLKEGDNTIINNGILDPNWVPSDPTLDSPIEFKPIYYPGEDLNDIYKQYLKLIADFPQDPNVMREPPTIPPPGEQMQPEGPEVQAPPLPPPVEIPTVPYPPGFEPDPPPFNPDQPLTPKFDDSPVVVPPARDWEVPIDPMPFFPIPQPFQKISVEGPSGGAASTATIFVILKSEAYSGGGSTQISNAQIYWSRDAVNWNLAITPIDNLLNLRAGGGGSSVANQGPLYFNGLWVYTFAWQTDPGNTFNNSAANAIVYSYDGVKWLTVWVPSGGQINAGVITLPVTNSSGAGPVPLNGYNFSNSGLVQPQNVFSIFIPCLNAPKPPVSIEFGDQLTTTVAGAVLVDPSQPAGSSLYSTSHLPLGITAVRFRTDNLSTPTQIFFDYTTTVITSAVAGSGAGLPSANWVNSLTVLSSLSTLVYGRPTGASLIV